MPGFRSRAASAHRRHVRIAGVTVEIPLNMKPWRGGKKAPDDFAGGWVKRLGGHFSEFPANVHPAHWEHHGDHDDVIAYARAALAPSISDVSDDK